jgi:DNA-binding transcriptional ArsR family regulator
MNAELISREAHLLLGEIADYEEPRLFMDEAPTLAELFKSSAPLRTERVLQVKKSVEPDTTITSISLKDSKGHIKDNVRKPGRREAVLSVIRSKGPSYIKDISTVIRDVSEKTIQRELSALVAEGILEKKGDRRWTTYSLV